MTAPAQTPSSAHLHAHGAGDAKHAHYTEQRSQSVLAWALVLTMGFAVIEVVTGFLSNSLALISDAGHMVTDAAALGLALLAQLPLTGALGETLNWSVFGIATALSMGVIYLLSLLCSLYPGWRAARLSPTQALHYE